MMTLRHWFFGTALVIGLATGRVQGGATTPDMILATATGFAAGNARSAVFEGQFDFQNAQQVGYPINLVVFQGSTFVRFPLAGAAVTGSSPELADGTLTLGELGALLAQGNAAAATVEVVTITTTRLRVTLPASFAAGTTTAIIAASPTGEDTLLSNPIAFVLP
jgi:hypothetical protein